MGLLNEPGGKFSTTRLASLVCVLFAGVLAWTSTDAERDVDSNLILYFLVGGTVPKVFQRWVEGKGEPASPPQPPPAQPPPP